MLMYIKKDLRRKKYQIDLNRKKQNMKDLSKSWEVHMNHLKIQLIMKKWEWKKKNLIKLFNRKIQKKQLQKWKKINKVMNLIKIIKKQINYNK